MYFPFDRTSRLRCSLGHLLNARTCPHSMNGKILSLSRTYSTGSDIAFYFHKRNMKQQGNSIGKTDSVSEKPSILKSLVGPGKEQGRL